MTIDERMPEPDVYERELPVIPYIKSLNLVSDIVRARALRGGSVLDLMTGTGYFPNRIKEARPDLSLTGVDIDNRFVVYGREKYPDINLEQWDVRTWMPEERYDVVMCTGAIHHLPYEDQERFIASIPGMMAPGGFAVLSDCHIDDYDTETGRRMAAARLGYEHLVDALGKGADDDVVGATIDIMENDVLMREFKTSVEKRRVVYERHFTVENAYKTWPEDGVFGGYGDYVFVLRELEK